MSDNDRNREMPTEPIRETERTTVVHTDSGRGGGSGVLIAVILLIAVLALLFFLFGGNLTGDADKGDINVNVEAPELKVPDVDIQVPDVDLKVPDVDLDVNKEPSENKG